MAPLCPTQPNANCCTPDCTNTDTMVFDQEITTKGEFFLFGRGLREGTGLFSVQLPPFCVVNKAYLYVNMYKSNDQDAGAFTITFFGTVLSEAAGDISCIGISGSTCFPNDNPIGTFDITEQSTYLRNRVYRADVTEIVKVGADPITGGNPLNPNAPNSRDDYTVETTIEEGTTIIGGIRIPGCNAGQGVALLVIVDWVEGRSAALAALAAVGGGGVIPGLLLGGGPQKKLNRERKIRIYHGSKLLVPPIFNANSTKNFTENKTLQDVYGGTTFFGLQDTITFLGNAKAGFGAGDTEDQNTKRMYINGSLLPDRTSPNTKQTGVNNFFGQDIRNGQATTLSSTREVQGSFPQPATSNATAIVGTDCIAWFLFVISGDELIPGEAIPMQNHMQIFMFAAAPGDTTINTADEGENPSNNSITEGNLPFPGPTHFIIAENDAGDKEIMKVTSKAGEKQSIWTVVRAQGGTTALEFLDGNIINLLATQSQMINWYGRGTNMRTGRRVVRKAPGELN